MKKLKLGQIGLFCIVALVACLATLFAARKLLVADIQQPNGYGLQHQAGPHARIVPTSHGISIEGVIGEGDYLRFLKEVAFGFGQHPEVVLMSPGGDVAEAMRIGRLIRKLRFRTSVPQSFANGQTLCKDTPADSKNCTCASACFLLFVAGVDRSGNVLGIHRAYVNHNSLRELSASEAESAGKRVKELVSEYLKEMDVPPSYTERMLSIPSGGILFLSEDDVEKDFSGLVPSLQEWVSAKCGDSVMLIKNINFSTNRDRATELANEAMKCKALLMHKLAQDNFNDQIDKAISVLKSSGMSNYKFLSGIPSDFQGKREFEQ